MEFLKTFFWIVLSAVVVIISINNWSPVTVNLWSGLQADVKLPVLLIFTFMVGLVPTMIYYRARQWRLTRRLESVDRELADLRGINRFHAPERAAMIEEPASPTTVPPPAEPEPGL